MGSALAPVPQLPPQQDERALPGRRAWRAAAPYFSWMTSRRAGPSRAGVGVVPRSSAVVFMIVSPVLVVSCNSWKKKRAPGSPLLGDAAAAPSGRFDACAGGSRDAAEELDHGGARLRVEIGEEPALLAHDVALDPPVELAPGRGRREQQSAAVVRMRRAGHVALALQGVHHPARRAFVEIEIGREVVQGHRSLADQGLQAVALADRDVVAADAVAVTELVDPDQVRERVVELMGVPLQGGIGGQEGQAGVHARQYGTTGWQMQLTRVRETRSSAALRQAAIQVELRRHALHRFEDVADVLPDLQLAVETDAGEVGGRRLDVLAVDPGGEGALLPALLDRLDLHLPHVLARADQGGGEDQAG